MPWNDAAETFVAVGGEVYVAPVGSTLPTDIATPLNSAFVGLGYTTDDGVSWSVSRDTADIGAWQSYDPIRTLLTARTVQATFGLQQWNEETVPFAFGGGTVSGSGPYTYELPNPEDGLDERALVIQVQDGDNDMRIVIPRGIVTEAVETNFQKAETAVLPITFKGLKSATEPIARVIADAAGFAAGS